jgi:hypothetical protein
MIRPATYMDVPDLLAMGRRFFDASGYADITSFHPESFQVTLENLLGSDNGLVLVAVKEKPVGMAAALLYPYFFNVDHKTAQEVFFWMDKEHRGIGAQLLDALIVGAKARGARSLSMIALESMAPDVVGGMYQRRGFRPSERSFIRSLA